MDRLHNITNLYVKYKYQLFLKLSALCKHYDLCSEFPITASIVDQSYPDAAYHPPLINCSLAVVHKDFFQQFVGLERPSCPSSSSSMAAKGQWSAMVSHRVHCQGRFCLLYTYCPWEIFQNHSSDVHSYADDTLYLSMKPDETELDIKVQMSTNVLLLNSDKKRRLLILVPNTFYDGFTHLYCPPVQL